MWLYNITIILYAFAIKIASRWIPKAKLWCDGRKDIFKRMAEAISHEDHVLWIHVASLGEFEQGRPLIEKIRKEQPKYKILLTFYSPSGYEVRKNYERADYIFYLPIDTPGNVKRFLDIAHPEIAIFVKYEFWLNMLFALHRRNIKTFIVSAIFRKNSIFFRSYGLLWRKALKTFNTIFVQNDESKVRLNHIGFKNVVVAGDTRFDRVAQIAQAASSNAIVERFKGTTPLLIAGSTWPADEALLLEIISQNNDIKFVIAPHEIEEERVEALRRKLTGAIRYSQIEMSHDLTGPQVLILDTMGQLSSIYKYASWAYIGGGFGVGIHNTLEAATFGLPIAFGPNYHKFKEATDMIDIGACKSVESVEELEGWFSPLRNDIDHYNRTSQLTKRYTQSHQGASRIIAENIFCR
ncbi:MAG: glycosyltransferase N-terminal domain-containing protein [Rikenellaceae bacterium]